MAYNELTTSLYSKRGNGDGINSNASRAEIYGHSKPFERPGKISDNWYLHTSSDSYRHYLEVLKPFVDKQRSKTREFNRSVPMWYAENVVTWEVLSDESLTKLAKTVGVPESSATWSKLRKKICGGYFFYNEGGRPTEDEIDDMLDLWENKMRVRNERLKKKENK